MSPLIETIRLNDGAFFNLEYHQQRMNVAFQNLFPKASLPDLDQLIQTHPFPDKGLYKTRIIYNCESIKIEYQPYQRRNIDSLQIVIDDRIDYSFKWEDRKSLSELLKNKGTADEILIVKDGLITDTSYSNIVFYDGQHWITPTTPLLKGTQRQFLLDHHQISEAKIRVGDLKSFKQAGLINAMMPMEEMPVIAIKNIFSD